MQEHIPSPDELAAPAVIVSADSHVGPRLVEDLRPYCPKEHLEAFDDYVNVGSQTLTEEILTFMKYTPPNAGTFLAQMARNAATTGQWNAEERLREMDIDSVAAEVIYHGANNNEPVPFVPGGTTFFHKPVGDLELVGVGYHIYNQWLADFCAVDPIRLLGVAQLPMWDVDAAVAEAEWAAAAGLRIVNLPAPRPGILDYDFPDWEPLWSACDAEGLTLTTHAGVPINGGLWASMEMNGYGSRRSLPMLVFGGVFERHPGLNLVITEIVVRNWWAPWARELDVYWSRERFPELPKPPSEYIRSNVFLGASFPPPTEVEDAITNGYADNFIWGRDYPHAEGTYQYPLSDDEPNMNRACLQFAFAGVPAERIRAMVADNGIRAFHLDRVELEQVAARIDGLTLEELGLPPAAFPEGYNSCIAPHPAAAGQVVSR